MSINLTQQTFVPWQPPRIEDSPIKNFFYINFVANYPLERLTKICVIGLAIGTLALGVIALLAVHQKIGGCGALFSLGDLGGVGIIGMGGVILLGVIGYCREIVFYHRKRVSELISAFQTHGSIESVFKALENQQRVFSFYKTKGRFLSVLNEKQTLLYLCVIQEQTRGIWLYYRDSDNHDKTEEDTTELAHFVPQEIARLSDGGLDWMNIHNYYPFDSFEKTEQFRTYMRDFSKGIILLYFSDQSKN